jgi:hypothetical protein
VGNAKYSGLASEQVIRSDEETSDEWRQEEQEQTRQLEGTDRSFNVPSIRGCQEGSELGNATSKRSCGGSEDGTNQQSETLGSGHEAMGESERSKIEPEMGRDIDGTTYGMDISELSGLSNSELAEIREWMVKGDNRTDELRSCGNGVVAATAERAFRVLMEELINK